MVPSRQPPLPRPTWAEISLPRLVRNYRTIKAYLPSHTQLMAVVKANAYGHGAVPCALALEREAAADWFGVALLEEAIELRAAGLTRPILCFGGCWPGQAAALVAYEVTPVVHGLEQAQELAAEAQKMRRSLAYHLKVDTGLGRLGVPFDDLPALLPALTRLAGLRLDGLMTHFAEADVVASAYTQRQVEIFQRAVEIVRAAGGEPTWLHLANSAGIHAHPAAWGNLARAGATLYGFTRDVLAPVPAPFQVSPVMSLHTRIVHLKTVPAKTSIGYGRTFTTTGESRIATLPLGYADGLRRAHSNNGRVIVAGQLAPIVGRISMDLTTIDVTAIPAAGLGTEVILLGTQGEVSLTAEELAAQIGTISYEIACGISARVPRIYQS